jgi:N utilization substance protein A
MLIYPEGNDEVRKLFHDQVPELVNGAVEIKAIARERGQRSMLMVHSGDPRVDPVDCCVGHLGVRVKSVVRHLSGENIDIIRWSETVEDVIRNVLAPVVVRRIVLDAPAHRATITVDSKRSDINPIDPTRLRLASRVVGWDLQLVEI